MSVTNRDKAELGVEENFLINGGGESGIAQWSAFNTTFSGGVPGSITPGSSFLNVSSTTTNPLSGYESLVLNVTTAAGSTGSGLITDVMTLTDAYLAKVIAAQFDYNFITNPQNVDVSGTSTQTIEVWVYNVGLGTWYQPAGFRSINTKGATGALVPGRTPTITFQSDVSNASNKNQYRLALIIRNDPVGTFSMSFDNVTFARPTRNSGPAVTDWQNYTPVWTSTSTPPSIGNGTIIGEWRRIGDSIEVRTAVISGSTTTYGSGSGRYLFSLPPGINIDTNKIASTTGSRPTYGTGFQVKLSGGNAWYNYTVAYESPTQFSLSVSNSDGAGTESAGDSTPVTPSAAQAGQEWRAEATFPVLGWSSDLQLSNDTDTRVVAARASTGSGQSIPNNTDTIINFDNVEFDTHAEITTGASWKYTFPVSGFYQIDVRLFFVNNATGQRIIKLYKNGIFTSYLAYLDNPSAPAGASPNGSTVYSFVAGDFISIEANQTSGGSLALGADANLNYVSIHRLSGPSVIAANETVAASFKGGSGTLNGSDNLITYTTKIIDTHGQYNSGIYTIPVSGVYSIQGALSINGTTHAGDVPFISVYINGVSLYQNANQIGASATSNVYLQVIQLSVPLNAGDTVAFFSNASGVSSPTFGGGSSFNYFSIIKTGN